MDAFEPAMRALLAEFPDMPATVIPERVAWTRSISVLRARVAQLHPLFASTNLASRTTHAPGELVQCDLWFSPVDIPMGFRQVARLPVLTMTSGYSRPPAALMIEPTWVSLLAVYEDTDWRPRAV